MVKTESFRGRDFITLLDYSKQEIETLIDYALDLKRRFAAGEPHSHILRDKTLFMIFYNTSLRTRNSFEAGMTQLGGHAHFLQPGSIYTPAMEGDEEAYSTERVADVARVLSRMGHGIAMRIYGEPTGWVYGRGNEIVRNFAYWAKHDVMDRETGKAKPIQGVPMINMECDKYHPCQGLADIMTVKEHLGEFKGRKFVMSWAYSASVKKPMAVPQSAIIAAAKMGMDVTLAYPKGFELDPDVIAATKVACEDNSSQFEEVHDMAESFEGADVVYPKCWGTLQYFADPATGRGVDKEAMTKLFSKNKNWLCDDEMMARAKKSAIYMHCLPADRGMEVSNSVIDGPQSVVFDEAENRLHGQKAVMSLTMR